MSEHEAGRATDALVAERLGFPAMFCARCDKPAAMADRFGCLWCGAECEERAGDHARDDQRLPAYSTDIAAAWGLVEWMRTDAEHGCEMEMWRPNTEGYTFAYRVSFYPDAYRSSLGEADTAPLAICRAFLAVTEPAPTERSKRSTTEGGGA